MNVFVLNSGRCGSMTFIQACRHIENYTAGHETRLTCIGTARLDYPDQHIEADNRLAWYLGRLDQAYGQRAFYVHLTRDPEATAASFARRTGFGIMQAYRANLLLGGEDGQTDLDLARDYLDTVNANIALFLRDKPGKMAFRLANAKSDFERFWHSIGAQGALGQALTEWDVHYNASSRD